jgi:uncharacterized membrane protein YphA (DoxX/SURF4 family)
MRAIRIPMRDLATRLATGAYILHSGLEKWHGSEAQARGVHGAASGAFPLLAKVSPATFLKALALAEIGIGPTLLTPVVPNRFAGVALSAFSGGLMTMYLRTPAMHKPNSVWPTPAGIGVSKDVWMLAIGVGLLADRDGESDRTVRAPLSPKPDPVQA